MNKIRFSGAVNYIFLSVIVSFFIAPVIWLFVTPFSSSPSLSISLGTPTLSNFSSVFKDPAAVYSFGNSIIIAVGVTLLTVICASLAAYIFSRYHFKGSNFLIFILILFSNIVSGTAAMVPLYMLNISLGLINSYLGVIFTIAGGGIPTSIFILKSFFDSIPKSYEEAALVDGSSYSQMLLHIFLPLSKKGIIVIATLSFISAWGNFLIPFILLSSQNTYPASVTIYNFYTEMGLPNIGLISAYALLYTLPVVIGYLVVNKVFGFSFYGGIKG